MIKEAQTVSLQQCEECLKVDKLKLIGDKWLCSKCLCRSCASKLIGIEKTIGLCSLCNANDHLADIDW